MTLVTVPNRINYRRRTLIRYVTWDAGFAKEKGITVGGWVALPL